MFDALVFDLDGTLWDALESSTSGWNEGLRSLGLDKRITVEELSKVTGKTDEECVQILLPDEFEGHRNLIEILGNYEKKVIQSQGGKLYASLEATITTLAQQYGLYLVSNCEEWYLEDFFKLSGLKEYFRDYNCHGISKENKSVMLTRLKDNYGFKKPAYIGDTETDEAAAKNAGYAFIHAGYGFGIAHQPDYRINSLKDLLDLLKTGDFG